MSERKIIQGICAKMTPPLLHPSQRVLTFGRIDGFIPCVILLYVIFCRFLTRLFFFAEQH